jgi:hypothetical protein
MLAVKIAREAAEARAAKAEAIAAEQRALELEAAAAKHAHARRERAATGVVSEKEKKRLEIKRKLEEKVWCGVVWCCCCCCCCARGYARTRRA